tara:strand:+ start:320 stop:1138 length:819 start_codon:yes stop_codon:yes gene_type:complete
MSGAWDIATATSIGTGVAKTQINGGNNLTKPTQATNLVEVVPYISSSGAMTAGESLAVTLEIDSFSVDLLPKRIIVPPIQSGLGTTISQVNPLLESYECNTGLQEGATSQFILSGTNQIAPTVATNLACALHYSTSPPNRPEHFYHKPDDETTFTTATTTSGNNFTINDGMWLEDMYVSVFSGVYTVSQSLTGYGEFSSNDFGNSLPLKVPMQPGCASLGATGSQNILQLASYHNVHMPMKTSCKINTSFTNDITQTAAASFIMGVGYTKQG